MTESAQLLTTPSGIRFFAVGAKAQRPAPTLFIFALSGRGSLEDDNYVKCGRILARKGWISVSVDVPAHDEDARPGEPQGLKGWRHRLDQNENFMASFVDKARATLDHLIADKYTDSDRIAVAGTSRGGFCALHFAAADPRVKHVVAFAPVTDLLVLEEFHGLENHAIANSLAAVHLAEKLVDRHLWICIGNDDPRVGSDQCFAFVRAVAKANLALKKPATVELHVMPSVGHATHATAHDEAAAWLAAKGSHR